MADQNRTDNIIDDLTNILKNPLEPENVGIFLNKLESKLDETNKIQPDAAEHILNLVVSNISSLLSPDIFTKKSSNR